MNMKSQKP